MRAKLTAAAIGLAAIVTTGAGAEDAPLMPWMVGCWLEPISGSREVWTSAGPNLLLGHATTFSDGRLVVWEQLRIAREDGKTTYWASPNGVPATPFTLVEETGSSVRFENAEHDFPTRIVYWREGDRLIAEVGGLRDDQSAFERFEKTLGCRD